MNTRESVIAELARRNDTAALIAATNCLLECGGQMIAEVRASLTRGPYPVRRAAIRLDTALLAIDGVMSRINSQETYKHLPLRGSLNAVMAAETASLMSAITELQSKRANVDRAVSSLDKVINEFHRFHLLVARVHW